MQKCGVHLLADQVYNTATKTTGGISLSVAVCVGHQFLPAYLARYPGHLALLLEVSGTITTRAV